MYKVSKYQDKNAKEWNQFVSISKNGTFLFHRDFMDYHRDRFIDHSLMIFKEEILVAVLPAHKIDDKIYSHLGLTYGGLLYTEQTKLADVIRMLRAVLEYLSAVAIKKLFIKLIPSIYHKYPSDEFSYALFVANATLVRMDSLCVIDNASAIPFAKTRKESIKRGRKNGLIIKEEKEFKLFWEHILVPNMLSKHGVSPTHSAEEIIRLHSKFPDNIRQFNVYHNNEIVAGTTVFVTDTVAHPQHISGNKNKNALGSLDFLYNYLITEVFKDKRYFDFGISNEEQGRKLNESLIFWKESFGGRTITQDFYEVETGNFKLLDKVLI